jgi:sugar phosphate isomerase/epimerase
MALTPAVPEAGWHPRLSVHALSTRRWSLAQDLDLYQRLGVRRISVSLPKLVAGGIDTSVAEIADRGLQVDGVYPGCAFDLGDPSSWDGVRDAMVAAIGCAHRLGAPTLQTTGGTAGGRPYEWAVDQLAAALGPVGEAARRVGVGIALEPTRPQFAHVAFVHSRGGGLAVARRLGLGLVPDSAHLWWEPGLADLLAEGVSMFATVQIADLDLTTPVLERVVPGDGGMALGALVDTLLGAGYPGPFELELIGRSIEDEGYEPALLRSLLHLDGLLRASPGPGGGAGPDG